MAKYETYTEWRRLPEPEINRTMEIELMSVLDHQMNSWVWKVYVNGTKMFDHPHNHIVSSNKIVVTIGRSPAATITGLKYSLTEPSGKLFLLICETT